MIKRNLYFIMFLFLLSACGSSGTRTGEPQPSEPEPEETETGVYTSALPISTTGKNGPVDLSGNINDMSLQELRLLKSTIYAPYGYLFMEADLRGYFTAHTQWYDSLIWARWEEDRLIEDINEVELTGDDRMKVNDINRLMEMHLKQNYVSKNGHRLANEQNIVNLFQFDNVSQELITKLSSNNFAIVPGTAEQLFHIYEMNDYAQVPSFITTDLFLQAFHMYFSYTLKSLEQERFIPIIKELTRSLYDGFMKNAQNATDAGIKDMAYYNATFYAIPYYLLSGQKLPVPESYRSGFDEEIKHIESLSASSSEFLSFDAGFPYSLFKPRGHYTRKEEMKRYFKAMMWLQVAPYCRDNQKHLKEAIMTALLLNTHQSSDGTPLLTLYRSVFEPVAFLVGQPDNLSILDIASFLKKEGVTRADKALDPEMIDRTDKMLVELSGHRNMIKPQIVMSCPDKINFMPQRYLIDNEILQTFVDISQNAEKAYPKGLEVFSVLGSEAATDILYQFEQEDKKWTKYQDRMDKITRKFENFGQWDASVYNKWIESLLSLQKKDKSYPVFMQTPAWDRKNLNTSLASWAELKHDAILYGEQPMAAECGGGGPPDPITVGYVEPNLLFWNKMNELVDLTDKMLTGHQLMTDDLKGKTRHLKDYVTFLTEVTKKELRKEKLSDNEYQTIEYLGSSMENFTLSVIEPGLYLDSWELVQGPDKSVAVVADIYTRNVPGCPKNGVLHVATGSVNNIYVVVDIHGYLYLTKGAVFSYYEFPMPDETRLTDEDWQKMLNENRQPDVPGWMKDIMIAPDKQPSPDEKIFYSSGC